MTALTILPQGITFEATPGMSLLAAIKAAGVALMTKCEGQGKCGACHLFVQEGRKGISKIQRTENEMLDTIVGVGSKSRLACQATLGEEPVTVELLGFKSGV
ncbi:2Fe-2S iron-sulfur cluster-binding protein [Aquabacterium sp.]|jgi:2Fe-2S ferredoxin|uniref:2Fe-2S iron-sulfur cluster-binding protein n=1 Tax=Aquabacterium sp. TaxID=1872578 RepID=UPI0025C09AD9|nr:2Fe-2S iron-sulfur cluster-binding protein [Aquabacterium sp.]